MINIIIFFVKITDLLGNILKEEKLISEEGSIDELLEAISNLICDDYKVTVLALSIPGVCKDGVLEFVILKRYEIVSCCAVERAFHLDIIMDNDVNVQYRVWNSLSKCQQFSVNVSASRLNMLDVAWIE